MHLKEATQESKYAAKRYTCLKTRRKLLQLRPTSYVYPVSKKSPVKLAEQAFIVDFTCGSKLTSLLVELMLAMRFFLQNLAKILC